MVKLTPAEELGLSGLSLDSRVRKVFYHLPPELVIELIHTMEREALKRSLTYFRGGQVEGIRLMLRPIGVMPDQLSYLNIVSLTILNALKRLPDLYLQDPAVRAVVPLEEAEEAWLRDTWGPGHSECNTVVGRLDAVVEFTSPMWKESLRFMEPNLTGVGGIHFGPTCEKLLAEVVEPIIERYDPQLRMEAGPDLRELFIQEVLDHAQTVGRAGQNICFIEPKYCGEGPDEQRALAAYFWERHGLKVSHADPAELELRDGEIWYDSGPVDIAYRDYEVRDLLRRGAEEGLDLAPMRALFKQNRIVSSLAGEFDHKSAWELLTDPRFTTKYFTAEERQVFRRHVLWTRTLSDRRTTLPEGVEGDLLSYVREEQEILVIKPNRSYGGFGVTLGHSASESQWDAAIQTALTGDQQYVVQRLAAIPVNEFPVVSPDGSVHMEPFYTVMGFAPTRYGLSILGRASQKEVVNVAQRGGMCAILVGKPPGRLVGPSKLTGT